MICEHKNPVRPDGPFTEDQCRICWLKLGGNTRGEQPLVAVQPPEPCIFRGKIVPLSERYKLGLGTLKDYYPCAKGFGTNGYVCPCRGCGPLCTGYKNHKDVVVEEPKPIISYHCNGATQEMTVAQMKDFIRYCPPGPWPDGWIGWSNVHYAHVELFNEYCSEIRPYPSGRFKPGRCIVSCVSAKPGHSSGKHLKNGYLPAAWVMANELRRFGCKLPIYFCHLGPLEWSPKLTAMVKDLGIEVIDLRMVEKKYPARILAGWESKAYAIEHAPYEEVLFLDADNVPIANPTYLFDAPEYKLHGAMFWPDLPPHDRKEWLPEVVWDSVGLPYDSGVDFESGQLLINKSKCWRELMATRWINDHSDRYYSIVFGDKSTFRLGWAKMGSAYAIPSKGAGWNGGAILQHDMRGKLLFEHCAQNKPTLEGYPKNKNGLPSCLSNPGECQSYLNKLRELWDGRIWDGYEGDDAVIAQQLIGRRFLYRRVGLGERTVRFLEDDRIGLGAARCEFSWGINNKQLAVSDIDGKPTMILDQRPDGVWVGNWLEYEKCPVELIPAE